MKYQDLIIELSLEARIPRKEAKRVMQALADVLQRNLIAGHDIHMRNIGRFQRGVVAPRGKPLNGCKPKPANVIHFRAARSFLNKMRQS